MGRGDGDRRRGQRDGARRERRRVVEVDEPGHGDPRVAVDGGAEHGGDRDGDDDASQRCRGPAAAGGGRRTPTSSTTAHAIGAQASNFHSGSRNGGNSSSTAVSPASRSAPTRASTVATTSASTAGDRHRHVRRAARPRLSEAPMRTGSDPTHVGGSPHASCCGSYGRARDRARIVEGGRSMSEEADAIVIEDVPAGPVDGDEQSAPRRRHGRVRSRHRRGARRARRRPARRRRRRRVGQGHGPAQRAGRRPRRRRRSPSRTCRPPSPPSSPTRCRRPSTSRPGWRRLLPSPARPLRRADRRRRQRRRSSGSLGRVLASPAAQAGDHHARRAGPRPGDAAAARRRPGRTASTSSTARCRSTCCRSSPTA